MATKTKLLFEMSDENLNKVYNDIRLECLNRQKGEMNASLIRGNEMAKRAFLVAVAGNHPILFLGPQNSGKTMFRRLAYQFDVVAFEARPCPCGYYGHKSVPCTCDKKQINKHLTTIQSADIFVEVSQPAQRDLTSRPGTSSEDIKKYLSDKTDNSDLNLSQDCQTLLKAASRELDLDPFVQEVILRVSRTIANLERSFSIMPFHICEAINYRMPIRRVSS